MSNIYLLIFRTCVTILLKKGRHIIACSPSLLIMCCLCKIFLSFIVHLKFLSICLSWPVCFFFQRDKPRIFAVPDLKSWLRTSFLNVLIGSPLANRFQFKSWMRYASWCWASIISCHVSSSYFCNRSDFYRRYMISHNGLISLKA